MYQQDHTARFRLYLAWPVVGLPIQHRHALHTASLPAHHRDPFDRLLVAQAQLESLVLVTADEKLAAYDGVDLLQA